MHPSRSRTFLRPEALADRRNPKLHHPTCALSSTSASPSSSSSGYSHSCSAAGSSCPSLASSRSTPPTSRSRDASAAGSNSEESKWCPGSCLSLSGSTSSNLDDCGLGLDSTCSCDDIDSDSELCTHTKSKRRAVRPTRSTAVLRHVDSMLLRRPSLKVRAVDEDDTSDMPPPPLPPRLAPEGTSSWSSSSGGSGDMETAQDPT